MPNFTPEQLALQSLDAPPLSPAASRRFLQQYRPTEHAAGLDALAARLDHLPLALELAGHYLQSHSPSVPAYEEQLQRAVEYRSAQKWRGNPTRHNLILYAACDVSWEQVRSLDARRLFLLAGQCAPNAPIPPELLEKAAAQKSAPGFWERFIYQLIGYRIISKNSTRIAYTEALSTLVNLGLLTAGEAGPRSHPFLAHYARHLAQEEAGGETPLPLRKIVEALELLTYQANEMHQPTWFRPLRPHVEHVAAAAEKAGLAKASSLWNNLGYYLQSLADPEGARSAFERALQAAERICGAGQVALTLNNLGSTFQDLGDLSAARVAYERASHLARQSYGDNHPQVAAVQNNLGSVLYAQGDLAGARAAFRRALRILEKSLPPGHSHIKNVKNSLQTLQEAVTHD